MGKKKYNWNINFVFFKKIIMNSFDILNNEAVIKANLLS